MRFKAGESDNGGRDSAGPGETQRNRWAAAAVGACDWAAGRVPPPGACSSAVAGPSGVTPSRSLAGGS